MTELRALGDISSGRLGRYLPALVDTLTRSHPTVPPDVVRRLVRDEFARFAGARVRVFIPILVERAVRQQLHVPSSVQ